MSVVNFNLAGAIMENEVQLDIEHIDLEKADTDSTIDHTSHDYERVEEDAENRCQGITAHGQCSIAALPGTIYCPMHGGRVSQIAIQKKELRNLKVAMYGNRLAELGNSDALLSLRDEVAVIRMTMEAVLNDCKDQTTLIAYAPQISDLVMKTGKLVDQCARVEERTGGLLSIDQLMQFSTDILDLIIKEVDDDTARGRIADEMLTIIESVKVMTP